MVLVGHFFFPAGEGIALRHENFRFILYDGLYPILAILRKNL